MADSDTTQADSPAGAEDAPPTRRFMAAKAGEQEGRALTLKAIPGLSTVTAHDAVRLPLLLEVRGRALRPGAKRPPLNVSLAIDRSAAMAGEPLEYAKRACAYVVDLLEPDDFLSIIAFEAEADIVLPARRVRDKALVKDYIQRLSTGRAADLAEGLLAACRQAASVKTPRTLNRVLLLTEGGAEMTNPNAERLLGQIAEQKAHGLTITTLGVGPEYSERLLAAIARQTGGSFYDVSRPERIPEVFRREMDSLTRTVGGGPRLRLSLARGVAVREASGQLPVFSPRSAEVGLVDVEGGAAIASYWELEMTPRPPGTYRIALAEIFYDDARTGRQEKAAADVVVEVTDDSGRAGPGLDPRVQTARDVARAGDSLAQTLDALHGGRTDRAGALQVLSDAKALMLDQGRLTQAQQMTQAMQEIEAGGAVEKTLTGTVTALDQGRIR